MIKFDCFPSRTEKKVVLLFGSGLIGNAVLKSLTRLFPDYRTKFFPWSWGSPKLDEKENIIKATNLSLEGQEKTSLFVIWAAGQSGFGSSEQDMELELEALRKVCNLYQQITSNSPDIKHAFYHISSAGGLFEGQINCTTSSEAVPLRPYGCGKMAQEKFIQSNDMLGHRLIIRPSTVYGFSKNSRLGLISTLVLNCIKRKFVTVSGSLTTQRDYVYAEDIGDYIAGNVLNDRFAKSDQMHETVTLAYGRPTSIFEMIGLVENHLNQSLMLRIDPHPENARDNTFSPTILPANFTPTPLNEGIIQTSNSIFSSILK